MAMMEKLMRWLAERYLARYFQETLDRELLCRHRVYGTAGRLKMDPTVVANNALFNLASGNITLEPYVFFGHNVSVLTGTHDIRQRDAARQAAVPQGGHDILIKQGAWLASNVTVLGPCIIGEHAVVAAGSLVVHDVPSHTLVGGVPAKIIKSIE